MIGGEKKNLYIKVCKLIFTKHIKDVEYCVDKMVANLKFGVNVTSLMTIIGRKMTLLYNSFFTLHSILLWRFKTMNDTQEKKNIYIYIYKI